jgi:hypothetical protein
MPQRLCARLYVEEGGCICAPVTGAGTALGTSSAYLSDGFQLAWDCAARKYTGEGFLCGTTTVDISISFDTTDGECSAMLTSTCLNYDTGTGAIDTRLTLPMGGTGTYDNDVKKQSCLDFTFLFEIDLSTCDASCETALILIEPEDTECIGTPMESEAKTGTGTLENCYYTKACMTFTQHSTGTGTGNTESEVCITTHTGTGDDTWVATFLGGSVTATVSQDATNLDELTLSITSGTPNTPTQTITDCLNGFDITWTIDNGDTLRLQGNQRVGCTDCKCLCRCLCVTRVNTADGSATRTTTCWDTSPGTGPEGWVGTGIGVNVACNYCTETTIVTLDLGTGTLSATPGTCPDIDISTSALVSGVNEDIYIECQKCTPCVLPDTISGFCFCADTPYSLTATIENVTDCACADTATATMYYNFNEDSPAWFGVFPSLCSGADLDVTLECDVGDCDGNSGCDRFRLTTCTNSVCADAAVGTADCCDPFEQLFTGVGAGCSSCDDPATADFDVRVTA